MDARGLDELHRRASEWYLEGDYDRALEAWRTLLESAPDDDRAIEGCRLCERMVDTGAEYAPRETDESFTPDDEIPLDLDALGGPSLSGEDAPPPLPAEPPPLPDECSSPQGAADAGDLFGELDRAVELAVGQGPASSQASEPPLDLDVLDAFEDVPESNEGISIDEQDSVEGMLIDRGEGAERPDPSRQGEGLDLGDPGAALPVGSVEPCTNPALASDPPSPSREAATDPGERFALDAIEAAEASAADPGVDPSADEAAAAELRQRADALYEEARAAYDAGDLDGAESRVERIRVLDDAHSGACGLEGAIREAREALEGAVEGVAAPPDAPREAGAVPGDGCSPDEDVPFDAAVIREAVRGEGSIDLEPGPDDLPLGLGEARASGLVGAESDDEPGTAPADAGTPEGAPISSVPREGAVRPVAASAATRAGATTVGRGRVRAKLLTAVAVIVLVSGGAYAYLELVSGSRDATPATGSSEPARAAAATEAIGAAEAGVPDPVDGASGEDAQPSTPAPADADPAIGADELMRRAEALTSMDGPESAGRGDRVRSDAAVAEGLEAIEAGDFAAAVIAFDRAMKADPGNREAVSGFERAGQRYREHQIHLGELARAIRAFEGGDYRSALKVLYRLPEDVEPSTVRRAMVNGWYNLGVVALKAGQPQDAIGHFEDALDLDPADTEASAARTLARRYVGAVRDSSYYASVETLGFRDPKEVPRSPRGR